MAEERLRTSELETEGRVQYEKDFSHQNLATDINIIICIHIYITHSILNVIQLNTTVFDICPSFKFRSTPIAMSDCE